MLLRCGAAAKALTAELSVGFGALMGSFFSFAVTISAVEEVVGG